MKLKFYILLGVIFAGLTGLAFWYFSATAPTKMAWFDPPVYQGQQVISSQVLNGGYQKKTSFVITLDVNQDKELVIQQYIHNLIDAGWDVGLGTKNTQEFTYIDRTKNIVIGGFFLNENSCPAFYLSVTFDGTDSNKTQVETTQTAGPCGSPPV